MHWIGELRDLAVGDAHRPEDLPLLRLFLRDPLRGPQDREARAVEPLGMEDVVSEHPAETRLELGPQERGTEPQVLVSVHIWIRHGGVPLRAAGIRARDVHVFSLPRGLPLRLDLRQVARFRHAPRVRRRAGERVRPRFLRPDGGATGLWPGPRSRSNASSRGAAGLRPFPSTAAGTRPPPPPRPLERFSENFSPRI